MVGILLVTHNGLGDSLADCVRHVLGAVPAHLKVLSVLADDEPGKKEAEGRALVAELDKGHGVLILCDVFGATPSNIALRLLEKGRVEGVAGVNLPMLLRAVTCGRGKGLAEARQRALDGGRDCIVFMDQEVKGCDVATRRTDH